MSGFYLFIYSFLFLFFFAISYSSSSEAMSEEQEDAHLTLVGNVVSPWNLSYTVKDWRWTAPLNFAND